MSTNKSTNKTTPIKTFKGFYSDLRCRDFQYEIGKTYECDGDIELCENGFHAIAENQSPLSVFDYYPPSSNGKPSRYCEVTADGNIKTDGKKIAASKLTIGAEIGIPGIVKAHIEWVKNNLKKDNDHKTFNTGDRSSASNTGDQSSASNTGYQSSASNTGNQSSASNTGYQSSAEVTGNDSVAVVTGKDCKVRASLGCAIVCVERGDWNGKRYPIIAIKSAIVDGNAIKPDTWYTVKNGDWVEVI